MRSQKEHTIPTVRLLIDQDTVSDWINRSGDSNPIHTDKAYTTEHGFRDTVVPGALITSVFTGMIERWKDSDEMISKITIAHKKITYINETLSFQAKIVSVDQKETLIVIEALDENESVVASGEIKLSNIAL